MAVDFPAGLLYYLQDSFDGAFQEGLASIERKAVLFEKWYLFVMVVAAHRLTSRYPCSADDWKTQQERRTATNALFEQIASIIFSCSAL